MNDLIRFEYQGQPVRTVVREGEPWWVAKDVCDVLGIQNARDTIAKVLEDDEKGVDNIYTPGGVQEVTIISEPGLYSLILRSRKPEAKVFKRWITHEVIPSIRKTGGYGKPAINYTELATAVAAAVTTAIKPLVLELRRPLPAGYRQATLSLPAASPNGEYYTIKGYGSLRGMAINNTNAVMLGREASRISRQRNINIHKAPDEKWGEVNSYHISVLKEVFTV